jgi:hypothetical protein
MANQESLGARPPLTAASCQAIVLQATPANPTDAVDPDTELHELGIMDDGRAAIHKARIQQLLNEIEWHVKQGDIASSPTATVADCRDSILGHAF